MASRNLPGYQMLREQERGRRMTDTGRDRFRRLRFAAFLLVLLVGLYGGFRVYQAGQTEQPEDRSLSFGLTVTPPQAGAAVPALTARRGDKVMILIQSEVAGEFHLHGYDREVALRPGSKASLAIEADRAGQFPIELHEPGGGHRDIAKLVVEP